MNNRNKSLQGCTKLKNHWDVDWFYKITRKCIEITLSPGNSWPSTSFCFWSMVKSETNCPKMVYVSNVYLKMQQAYINWSDKNIHKHIIPSPPLSQIHKFKRIGIRKIRKNK